MATEMGNALVDITDRFRTYRALAESALDQADDAAFFATLDDEANSLATLVKHLAGNYRSRWTDFLTTDGDMPDRHRDTEFELDGADTREALMNRWAESWQLLEETLADLAADDLARTVTIRAQPLTVQQALLRALTHTAYHVGQIVLLAKHHAGTDWASLSIPRGQSEQFAAEHRRRYA